MGRNLCATCALIWDQMSLISHCGVIVSAGEQMLDLPTSSPALLDMQQPRESGS